MRKYNKLSHRWAVDDELVRVVERRFEQPVRLEATADEWAEGLVEITLELPHQLPGGAEAIELGGCGCDACEVAAST